MKKIPLVHPFLFMVYPILHLFLYNQNTISFLQFFIILIISLLLILLLLFLIKTIFKNYYKAGLYLSFVLIVLFFSKPFFQGLKMIGGAQCSSLRYRHLLIIFCLFFFVLGFIANDNKHKRVDGMTKIFNFVSISLVILCLAGAFSSLIFKKRFILNSNESTCGNIFESNSSIVNGTFSKPDIYYIILDSYTSSEVLAKYYNFSNTDFLDFLSGKGFYIVPEARSNYSLTALSLASSMNMQYLNFLLEKLRADSDDIAILLDMMKNNNVSKFLKKLGYNCIYIGFDPRFSSQNYDINLVQKYHFDFLTFAFLNTLLDRSFFGSLKIIVWLRDRYFSELISLQLKDLSKSINMKGPKFIFAHIYAPHPPDIFNYNGRLLTFSQSVSLNENNKYLAELKYINQKIIDLVESLLTHSKIKPIIVLQGDHGNYYFNNENSPLPSPQSVERKMGILNAYYLPGVSKNVFYGSVTPVNTFRLIFNKYFLCSYDLLEDKSYFSYGYSQPFRFFNFE